MVVAGDEAEARRLLDAELKDHGLAASNEEPYTLVEMRLDEARAVVLNKLVPRIRL